jgi:hypothetical protein
VTARAVNATVGVTPTRGRSSSSHAVRLPSDRPPRLLSSPSFGACDRRRLGGDGKESPWRKWTRSTRSLRTTPTCITTTRPAPRATTSSRETSARARAVIRCARIARDCRSRLTLGRGGLSNDREPFALSHGRRITRAATRACVGRARLRLHAFAHRRFPHSSSLSGSSPSRPGSHPSPRKPKGLSHCIFECLIVEGSSQAQNHLSILADRYTERCRGVFDCFGDG